MRPARSVTAMAKVEYESAVAAAVTMACTSDAVNVDTCDWSPVRPGDVRTHVSNSRPTPRRNMGRALRSVAAKRLKRVLRPEDSSTGADAIAENGHRLMI